MIRNLLSRLVWGRPHETPSGTEPVTRRIHESVTKKTYHSLDDVPPHLRAQAEALMAQAQAKGAKGGVASASATTATYQFTGDDGITHTYNSVDEMPLDVRARFEAMRRSGPG
jgi:hypothetical protein